MLDKTYLLYPVTPKEVITRDHERVWWSTAPLTPLLPWQLLWLPVFSSHGCCFFHDVRVMVDKLPDLKPPCYMSAAVDESKARTVLLWRQTSRGALVCVRICAGFLAFWRREKCALRFGISGSIILQMWQNQYLGQLQGGDATCVERQGKI